MTPKEILAENYDQIEGICRRLPMDFAVQWEEGLPWKVRMERCLMEEAVEEKTVAQYAEALKHRQRGQRLVVIVTASETLYQFV